MSFSPLFWGSATGRGVVAAFGPSPNEEWYVSCARSPELWAFELRRSPANTMWRDAHATGQSLGWHHLAARYNDTLGLCDIFVDGVNTTTTRGGPSGSRVGNLSGPLRIGRGHQNLLSVPPWRGRLTAFAFFTAALSDSAIAAIAASTSLTAHDSNIAAAGPEAYWPMQEPSGGITDTTGHGHNGSPSSSPVYRQSGPWPGSSAIGFDGVDDWFDIPDSPAWSSTSFTVAGWIWALAGPGWLINRTAVGA